MKDKFQELHDRLKAKNPDFDKYVELGKFLMRHIDTLTPEERKRYDELNEYFAKKADNQK